MDPLTQLSVGAAVAVAISPREHTRWAAILGAVAGAAQDDDSVQSDEPPPMEFNPARRGRPPLPTPYEPPM